jgi:hypothetical protein
MSRPGEVGEAGEAGEAGDVVDNIGNEADDDEDYGAEPTVKKGRLNQHWQCAASSRLLASAQSWAARSVSRERVIEVRCCSSDTTFGPR